MPFLDSTAPEAPSPNPAQKGSISFHATPVMSGKKLVFRNMNLILSEKALY
jgi:hypothetical protein